MATSGNNARLPSTPRREAPPSTVPSRTSCLGAMALQSGATMTGQPFWTLSSRLVDLAHDPETLALDPRQVLISGDNGIQYVMSMADNRVTTDVSPKERADFLRVRRVVVLRCRCCSRGRGRLPVALGVWCLSCGFSHTPAARPVTVFIADGEPPAIVSLQRCMGPTRVLFGLTVEMGPSLCPGAQGSFHSVS